MRALHIPAIVVVVLAILVPVANGAAPIRPTQPAGNQLWYRVNVSVTGSYQLTTTRETEADECVEPALEHRNTPEARLHDRRIPVERVGDRDYSRSGPELLLCAAAPRSVSSPPRSLRARMREDFLRRERHR
jgi:hypothetical protein